MREKKQICWLQLSDLHIFYSTEWEIMLKSYEDLAKVFKPNFIVVTGDFCHKKRNRTYDDALKFLNKLVDIFSLDKSNFFFVPGNHDVSNFKMRTEIIAAINGNIEKDPDFYLGYSEKLQKSFHNYCAFVRKFYGDSLAANDKRITDPSGVYVTSWKNKINIVTLNSALISNGEPERHEIVDIQKLSQIASQIDQSRPTIVLAHHAPSALVNSQRVQLDRLLTIMNARAYLCGDEHKLGREITNKFDVGNQTVGIVCGKSTAEQNDTYSDVCVIGYTWEGNRTNVEIFKWHSRDAEAPYQFVKSDIWYHHVDKPFSFKMTEGDVPAPSITDRMAESWKDFLTAFEEEDQIINQKLNERQIKNKTGNPEPFKSEKIMRSLIMIGIPFPAVADITKRTIDSILDSAPSNTSEWKLDTKTIRLKVLESIRALDSTPWATEIVGNWCMKYIRRYGHNNQIIQFCNIPKHLNHGETISNANYKFIKEIFLPDLFQTVCPSFNMDLISTSQKTNLADEIISFINECDLYLIDYVVFKQMMQEIVTKPPHPWIIDNQRRKEIITYDRRSVESNLNQIVQREECGLEIPFAIFVELLHHTSAMILDRYFSFCGCTDLDSFNILINCFKKMMDSRFDPEKWDLNFEGKEIKSLFDDFRRHGINVLEYYDKLRAVNPQKVPMSHGDSYIAAIKDFACVSLHIMSQLEPG